MVIIYASRPHRSLRKEQHAIFKWLTLHDRTGRLENSSISESITVYLHDRTGRLEK
ncbi:Heat shock protein GrpE [Moraxella catarrhalis]|nr:Heat shock protein GrpE [Moraxella catarrhalis]